MPDPKNRLPRHGQRLDDETPATEAPETRPPSAEPASPKTQRPEIATNVTPGDEAPELSVPVDTVAWIILKAREFDVKDPASIDTDEEDGHNALGVLEDRSDDPTADELRNWISDLDEDAQAELVAIMWLGRSDDEDASTFPQLVEEARGRQRTADYLLGTPRLGDYLEEGLEKLGVDTAILEGFLR